MSDKVRSFLPILPFIFFMAYTLKGTITHDTYYLAFALIHGLCAAICWFNYQFHELRELFYVRWTNNSHRND